MCAWYILVAARRLYAACSEPGGKCVVRQDPSSLEDLGEDPAFTEQEVPGRGGADSAGLESSQAK